MSQTEKSPTQFDVSYSEYIREFKTEIETCRAHIILDINNLLQQIFNGIPSSCADVKLLQVAVDMKLLFSDNCKQLETHLRNIESSVSPQNIRFRLDENIAILRCLDELIKRLAAADCSLNFKNAVDILENVICTLLTAFSHCKNNEDAYDQASPEIHQRIVDLFRDCNNLQVRYLEYLNGDNIECLSQDNARPLVRVINAIIDVGKVVTNMDLKTMAQLWKGFVSLIKVHAVSIRSFFDAGPVLQFFCEEIATKIDSAYSLEVNQRSLVLKIVCFLLKIVVKLCEYFAQHLTSCYSHLYELMICLYGNSRHFVVPDRIEIATEIETVVLAAVDLLLGALIEDENFARFVCVERAVTNCEKLSSKYESSSTHTALALIFFRNLLQKLSLTTVEKREKWLEHSVLEAILDHISQHSSELYYEIEVAFYSANGQLPQQFSLYDALVVHLSSFVICSLPNDRFAQFEQLLVTHLLMSSLAVKLFISDVWCVVIRYGNAELRFKHAVYLIQIATSMGEDETERVWVVSLAKRILANLSKQQQKKIKDLVSHNRSLMVELDFRQDLESETLVIRSNEINSNLPATDSIELAYYADKLLPQIPHQLEVQIEKWWRELSTGKICEPRRFIKCLRSLSSLKFRNNDAEIALKPYFNNIVHFQSFIVKLNVLKYVKRMAQCVVPSTDEQHFCKSISSFFRVLLSDRNVIVRMQALEAFSYFSHTTRYEQVILLTVSNDSTLGSMVANYLQSKITSESTREYKFDSFLADLFERKISPSANNSTRKNERCSDNEETTECKKMKLEYDCVGEASKIESSIASLLQNIDRCELKFEEKESLRKLLNTVEKIRSYV